MVDGVLKFLPQLVHVYPVWVVMEILEVLEGGLAESRAVDKGEHGKGTDLFSIEGFFLQQGLAARLQSPERVRIFGASVGL